MKAIVIEPVCPLMSRPQLQCERADEVLSGMVVELLEEVKPGWYLARTPYRYEGYLQAEHVLTGDHLVRRWTERPKQVVLKGICDVLSGPAVACFPLVTLTRGAILSPAGTPNDDGWLRVELPDGREGYTKCSFLGEYYEKPRFEDPAQLRKAVVDTALTYRGTHYRWGGKTPMGIDCSGLVSMSYLLNGVVIYRDANIVEGFPVREIPRAHMEPGDLLFFPGHVAMYLGEGKYLHSTAKNGSDGVVINSLDPEDPDYRADLDQGMTAVGTVF